MVTGSACVAGVFPGSSGGGVTGAGDTVVATLALGLASGCSLKDSAVLANHAAGIVVGKVGTASVTVEELRSALGS